MRKRDLIRKYRLKDCTRCGNECAVACPVYRFYGTYHPQQLARLFLEGGAGGAKEHRLIWFCVNCRACTEACPFDVEFIDFIRELRVGRTNHRPAFGGLVHLYQRMLAGPDGQRGGSPGEILFVPADGPQNRLDWIDGSLDINGTRGTVLFTGCLPFFESAFGRTCGIRFEDMMKAAVGILNRLGVSPVVLGDEKCCGRDMYDIGDRRTFRALAEFNINELKKLGARTVITICPECAYTIRHTYSGELGEIPFEVLHITEYISERMDVLNLVQSGERITFHDPCYLCRYMGVFDAPRRILGAVSSEPLIEMERSGRDAPCCGAGSWVNHGGHTRASVNERLVEAHRSGAEVLVTACPKCSILFKEVNPDYSWKQSPVEVRDLLTMVASALGGKKR